MLSTFSRFSPATSGGDAPYCEGGDGDLAKQIAFAWKICRLSFFGWWVRCRYVTHTHLGVFFLAVYGFMNH